MHPLYKCPQFNKMHVKDRIGFVEENGFCLNCLRANHTLPNCRIKSGCKNCNSNDHHTLLHIYNLGNAGESNNPQVSGNSLMSFSNTNQRQENIQTSNVLLSTALLSVKSQSGEVIQLKAIIDGGSQSSLASRGCVERLKLPLRKTSHCLLGINGVNAETSLFMTDLTFSPHFGSESFHVEALVVNKVTPPLPNFRVQSRKWPHIENLQLADPQFHTSSPIDILIGCDLYPLLLTGTPIIGPSGTPVAIPSKLGFLLTGTIKEKNTQNSSIICHSINANINETLQTFWNIEAIPQKDEFTDEDQECEKLFENTFQRDSEGRYTVKLPFRADRQLGNSQTKALKRFYSLENTLNKKPDLKARYTEFMNEYINLGHMTPLNFTRDTHTDNYYLPHHGVINENSSSTKLRVVFDASQSSSNGKSLNDVLLKGPPLHTEIFENLLRFRTYRVAVSADICKMYRQIRISEDDRKYQRIFWRENPTDPLITFKLNTVTYGLVSSPFLALRTVQQLCTDEKDNFPDAAKIAKTHFYVDDFLAGADSVSNAKSLVTEMQRLMDSGCLPLRKWSSSHEEVLREMPEDLKANSSTHAFEDVGETSQKILGLFWNLQADTLQVRAVEEQTVTTKRQLLSVIARTFDPLGLVAPATVLLKILLQDVWKSNLAWDDPIPHDILSRWDRFRSEMYYFKEMKIPRYIQVTADALLELHGFCDASTKAYASVVYLKVNSNEIFISLVAAKTRVAPVKSITLPRLELQGALLLSELITTVLKTLPVPSHSVFLWSDSTITLSWIANPPKQGNPFVKHRVDKISSLTSEFTWNHIPGKENPADCASRGLYPSQLQVFSDWFSGPQWLKENNHHLQLLPSTYTEVSDMPATEDLCLVTQTPSPPNALSQLITKSSSFLKLLRVTAWILRFLHNSKSPSKTKGSLLAQELNCARTTIVKMVQQEQFASEIKLIANNKPLPTSSKLISLNVFLDQQGILRVGGRLSKHQTLSFDHKFPMLIPKRHPVTSAIIRYFHQKSLHSGPEMVLSLIRQTFWIPDGRSTVRHELRSCVQCIKHSARPVHQRMGDLPLARITASRPFEKTGIDFAGPINTKCQHQRKSTTFKSYICLFICMSTRAVHLEAVSSLSTDAFLAALRRFVSRRGAPSELFSDNGTNFIGASSYLKALFKLPREQPIQDFSSSRSMHWHFIPPYAPNMGGLWEASIKLAKRHLSKTCQGTLLNFEEFSTVLCQIEACINSRPLTPLSTSTNDLRALTPGHFLIGAPLLEIPENPITNPTSSLSSRWRLLLQMKDSFWKRWTRDLLHTMQPRQKWQQERQPLHVGDLVLLQSPSTYPGAWSLGRITKIFPGQDNITRVASVKTQDGERTRALNRLVVLPFSSRRPPEDVA